MTHSAVVLTADEDGLIAVTRPDLGAISHVETSVPASVTVEPSGDGIVIILADLQPHQRVTLRYQTGAE